MPLSVAAEFTLTSCFVQSTSKNLVLGHDGMSSEASTLNTMQLSTRQNKKVDLSFLSSDIKLRADDGNRVSFATSANRASFASSTREIRPPDASPRQTQKVKAAENKRKKRMMVRKMLV